jgi:alpha-L-glutamate ligase-like protein
VALSLADDKVLTKEVLEQAGLPVPATLRVYRYFFELQHLREDLAAHAEFVVKPARGRGGGGIVVITGRTETAWLGIDGRLHSVDAFRRHLGDILFGVYSFDLGDSVLVEERIRQHPAIEELSPLGLADVRVIVYQDRPTLTMIRVPISTSKGRANLHQGGLGIALDLASGRTGHAQHNGSEVTCHPDTGLLLAGRSIPFWDEVLRISRRTAEVFPLKYLGIDIVITPSGPVLLEINVRPGLEIQNVTRCGLRSLLDGERERI